LQLTHAGISRALQPLMPSAWYLAPHEGQPNMDVVTGWRHVQHIGGGVEDVDGEAGAAAEGMGATGVDPATGVMAGSDTKGAPGTAFTLEASSRSRSTCTPSAAKATRRMAPRRAMANEVLSPLSPEVPVGSPVDDTVNAKEAVDAVL